MGSIISTMIIFFRLLLLDMMKLDIILWSPGRALTRMRARWILNTVILSMDRGSLHQDLCTKDWMPRRGWDLNVVSRNFKSNRQPPHPCYPETTVLLSFIPMQSKLRSRCRSCNLLILICIRILLADLIRRVGLLTNWVNLCSDFEEMVSSRRLVLLVQMLYPNCKQSLPNRSSLLYHGHI